MGILFFEAAEVLGCNAKIAGDMILGDFIQQVRCSRHKDLETLCRAFALAVDKGIVEIRIGCFGHHPSELFSLFQCTVKEVNVFMGEGNTLACFEGLYVEARGSLLYETIVINYKKIGHMRSLVIEKDTPSIVFAVFVEDHGTCKTTVDKQEMAWDITDGMDRLPFLESAHGETGLEECPFDRIDRDISGHEVSIGFAGIVGQKIPSF